MSNVAWTPWQRCCCLQRSHCRCWRWHWSGQRWWWTKTVFILRNLWWRQKMLEWRREENCTQRSFLFDLISSKRLWWWRSQAWQRKWLLSISISFFYAPLLSTSIFWKQHLKHWISHFVDLHNLNLKPCWEGWIFLLHLDRFHHLQSSLMRVFSWPEDGCPPSL